MNADEIAALFQELKETKRKLVRVTAERDSWRMLAESWKKVDERQHREDTP